MRRCQLRRIQLRARRIYAAPVAARFPYGGGWRCGIRFGPEQQWAAPSLGCRVVRLRASAEKEGEEEELVRQREGSRLGASYDSERQVVCIPAAYLPPSAARCVSRSAGRANQDAQIWGACCS